MNDEESALLIEAVSLLVQRQRESETWLAEQFRQTAFSDSVLDRRMAEIEERLGRIQTRLGSLAAAVDPDLAGAGDVARLKQGLESLTNGAAGFPARPHSLTVLPTTAAAPIVDPPARPRPVPDEPGRGRVAGALRSATDAAARVQRDDSPAEPAGAGRTDYAPTARVSAWDVFGSTPGERVGLALMGGGTVALLYLVLRLLGFQ